MIAVDSDLPLTVPESGLTALDELSTINRTVGFLIGQGHPPEQARATLRGGAASAGDQVPHVCHAVSWRRGEPVRVMCQITEWPNLGLCGSLAPT
jgi:hypothetical protein